MRRERSVWAAFLIPTLLPGLDVGVSAAELLAIVSCLLGGTWLVLNYARTTRLPATIWLMVAYLLFSLVGLSHDPPGYFLSHFAGGLAFTVACVVGGCAPARLVGSIIKWLFLLALIGSLLDIGIDLAGWSPRPDKQVAAWEVGLRGRMTSRSLNGMYLAPFMAFMVVAGPTIKWRVLGACALIVVFYHVAVLGQGRGSSALAFLGMMAVFSLELRSLLAILLTLGPFMAVAASGLFDEEMAPFLARVTSEDLSDVDRIRHARVGEMLVRNMDSEEVLFGMNYMKVFIANGSSGMHNAFFDILTRFGLVTTMPWLVFNVVSTVAACVTMLNREVEREKMACAAVLLQLVAVLIAGGIFVNWRGCVFPGICTGLVLQGFHAEGRLWSRS